MLKKYNHSRSNADNIKLGSLTAFSAGMVNVISVIVFFSFTSNVTGHYAILAQEIAKGNWYQAAVVCIWVSLFFFGNFVSNFIIIHSHSRVGQYIAHATPLALEIVCLLFVGVYLQHYYQDTLEETEVLVGFMLFAMGLQNGLTATISNSAVKTTHLTGLTTDLGILFSMFTKREFRSDQTLIDKAKLLLSIMFSYMAGGIVSGIVYYRFANFAFYAVSCVLAFVILYDYYQLRLTRYIIKQQEEKQNKSKTVTSETLNKKQKSQQVSTQPESAFTY